MIDPVFNGGHYHAQPVNGLKAAGINWAAWGLSQEWFFYELYKELGAQSPEDYARNGWETMFAKADANDLVSHAITWQRNNVGNSPGFDGDLEKALRSIRARVLYMPSKTDLYFTTHDSKHEASFVLDAQYTEIPSLWGHLAGCGASQDDASFVNETIRKFLEEA
jgi:homoserine O-acetyltransferase